MGRGLRAAGRMRLRELTRSMVYALISSVGRQCTLGRVRLYWGIGLSFWKSMKGLKDHGIRISVDGRLL